MPCYIWDLERDPNLGNYPYAGALRLRSDAAHSAKSEPGPLDLHITPSKVSIRVLVYGDTGKIQNP